LPVSDTFNNCFLISFKVTESEKLLQFIFPIDRGHMLYVDLLSLKDKGFSQGL